MVCSTSTIGGLVTQRRTNKPTNCNTQEPTQPAINNGIRRQLQDTASESSASDTNPNQGTIKPHRKQQQPRTHPHHSQTKQVNASIRYLLSLYNNSGMRPSHLAIRSPATRHLHPWPHIGAPRRRVCRKQETSCAQPPVSSQLAGWSGMLCDGKLDTKEAATLHMTKIKQVNTHIRQVHRDAAGHQEPGHQAPAATRRHTPPKGVHETGGVCSCRKQET